MFYQKMLARSKELTSQILSIQKEIKKLPVGDLCCNRNGPYVKWYNRSCGKEEYIPKKQQAFAEQLAIRKYKLMQLKELQNEKEAISAYLKCHNKHQEKASELLNENSCYRPLLTTHFDFCSEDADCWVRQPYEKNNAHPENLIHKTIAGYNVRSKSESLIVSTFYANHIPFRYECALCFGEITIFPDFTIMHPYTRKLYYWEHFGMMDDSDYIRKAYKKLQLYTENGIIPSVNLIMTFETLENPLDSEMLEKIVQFYFK